jgi:hypothetical protein
MARAWYIPRLRHLMMQLVMWFVLGASVILAAVLDQHLRRQQIIEFSAPITDDSVTFRFPADWKIGTQRNEADVTEHFATDSSSGAVRKLTILRQPIPHPMAPAEYILRTLTVSGTLDARDFKGIDIDGWPGQSIYWEAHRFSLGAIGEFQFTNCSAIILANNQAIMIRLDKDSPFDAADQRLYRQVLDQVHITAQAPADGGAIHLRDDISINIPTDFRLYPRVDPLSNQAMVAQITDDGGWTSAQFVPVAVPGNQPSPSLLEGLAAREQLDAQHASVADAWITADVSAEGPNLWTISPQDAANEAISPRRIAHLMTTESGWGLLVILSAEPPASQNDLNHLWEELFAGIHLGAKSPPLTAALQTGAAIAQNSSLRPPGDTWWLWSRASVPIGFTHGFADPDAKYGSRYTVRRGWNGAATAVLEQWGMNPDSTVWSRMSRSDAAADFDNPLIPLFDQTTVLGDNITTIVHEPSGRESQVDSLLSPAFVLSRSMPRLLVKVDANLTAFLTDRFPGVEAEHLPVPLLLLAQRVHDVSPMQCIQTEVNGTGALARWYFHADQTLDHADFTGELHLRPSSDAEVESAFAGDRRLTIQPH